MTAYAWLIVAFVVVLTPFQISEIGKPRKPRTAADVSFSILFNYAILGFWIFAMVHHWRF